MDGNMSPLELLKSVGFYEKGGWLWSPFINEAVFHLTSNDQFDINNMDFTRVMNIISSTAFNNGYRKGQLVTKDFLREKINKTLENI